MILPRLSSGFTTGGLAENGLPVILGPTQLDTTVLWIYDLTCILVRTKSTEKVTAIVNSLNQSWIRAMHAISADLDQALRSA